MRMNQKPLSRLSNCDDRPPVWCLGSQYPRVVPTISGAAYTQLCDEHGHPRLFGRFAMLPGATLDHHKLTIPLMEQIGATACITTLQITPGLHRDIATEGSRLDC